MAQARAAAQEQDDYFERLREEGWEYDEMVHCWTHPDHPGVTITS